ncbi:MAG: cytochrome c peroxidase, partial [Bacteroidota bacterium]
KLAEDDLFHLLANSLNYHYLTTLNAYDRIDTEKALLEFKYVINTQIELLSSKTLSLEAQKIVVQLDNMLLSLKNQSWEEVDRVLLYKQWIAPIIKQYSNLRISSTKNEVHFDDSEALLFSSNFLNANTHTYDIDTTNFEDLEELGRLLFYDPMLSGNNKRSCASCHKPSKAFSDGRQTSIAFDYTSKLKRNAPSLINSIYKGRFLHDLSKDNLFDQITAVINHSMEFNTSWKEIEQKIESSEEYVQRFETCFSSTSIDSNKVADALTAYLASLTSFNSPFDQYMSGKSKKEDAQLEAGYNLFMGEASCGNCHVPPLFGGINPTNFKEPLYFKVNSPEIKKEEKGLATNEHYDERYNHFFAVPSLRNLNYTTPYFHNGSLLSLEACIDAHTIEGSNFTKELTENQKSTILYFLETLNDTTLTNTKERMNLPLTDGTLAPKKRRSAGIY